MTRPPPRSTRTDTLFPYTTLFRSVVARPGRKLGGDVGAAFEIQRARAGHLDRPANPVGMVGCRLQRAHAVAAVEQQRSEEHTSELQSLMRISYAVFCLKKKTHIIDKSTHDKHHTDT